MTTPLGLVLKVSWLSTPPMVKPNASVSIQIWHFGLKCQRIIASVKTNRKRLKVVLTLRVKNFCLSSVASKLVEFPLFDDFFPDLAKFQDLNVFLLFNFSYFLACSISFSLISNLSTSPLLTPSRLGVDFSSGTVVFNIEVSGAAILLKPWMNHQ